MPQQNFSQQTLLAKANEKDQLGEIQLNGLMTFRILHGIVWDFILAK